MTGPLAIDRALAALARLAEQPRGIGLAELSRQLAVPKTSLLGVMRGLLAGGHVVLEDRIYRLGPASLAMAHMMLKQGLSLAQLAEPILQKLAIDSGETSVLAVMATDERAAEYVAKIESRTAIRFAATVGDRRPLHASASGRLLAAYRDETWIDRFLADARLDRETGLTVTDPAELRRIFHRIRADGYAATAGETTEGVGGLAVPVLDATGSAIAALLIGGPIERVLRHEGHLLPLLKRAGVELSLMVRRIS